MVEHQSPCPELQTTKEKAVRIETIVEELQPQIDRRFEEFKTRTDGLEEDVNGIAQGLNKKLDTLNVGMTTVIAHNGQVKTDLKLANQKVVISVLVSIIVVLLTVIVGYFKLESTIRADMHQPTPITAPR